MRCKSMVRYHLNSVDVTFRYGLTAGGEALASSMASAMEGVLVRFLIGIQEIGDVCLCRSSL